MTRPQLKDLTAWHIMLLTHRRILLERLIAEFPDVLNTQRSKVEYWRARLNVTRTPANL